MGIGDECEVKNGKLLLVRLTVSFPSCYVCFQKEIYKVLDLV